MHNGIDYVTVELSDGTTYVPEKGKKPVCPCLGCPDSNKGAWCNGGFGVCAECMDYEHKLWAYRHTVFD